MSLAWVHGSPHVEGLALPKSVESGMLSLNKAGIRWMRFRRAGVEMAATLLRRGSSGREVIQLQSKLNAKGPTFLPRLTVDSIFGPRTDARVREFQRLSGLQVDGIVGPSTRAALDRRSPTPNPADAAAVSIVSCIS